jgi:hypothetical protein
MRWLVAMSRKPQIRDFLNVLNAGDDRGDSLSFQCRNHGHIGLTPCPFRAQIQKQALNCIPYRES